MRYDQKAPIGSQAFNNQMSIGLDKVTTRAFDHGPEDSGDTGVADFRAPQDDRRGQQRHMTVMRAARLSSKVHRIESLGVVRNISEGGMMIDAGMAFEVGEHVVISLLDGDRVDGEIMWKDGSTIGVRFESWMSVDHLLTKSRLQEDGMQARPPRLAIRRSAIVRIGGYMTDTEIYDISQRGAKIKLGKNLAIDSRVQISLDTLRPVSASVKWQAGSLIGLEFHRTLTVEELSSWVPTATASDDGNGD